MSLINRELSDLMMFAYARGAQRAMPTISDARAVEKFLTDFGHLCNDCTPEALRKRLVRMKAEMIDDSRTKIEQE